MISSEPGIAFICDQCLKDAVEIIATKEREWRNNTSAPTT